MELVMSMRDELKAIGVNTSGWDERRIIQEYNIWFLANVNAQIFTAESRQYNLPGSRITTGPYQGQFPPARKNKP